jgi:very-short-patch-repair endonuclease
MGTVRRRANPRARQLRRDQTDAERLLWQRLRSRQLSGFKFRRQVPMGPYIVDFLCREVRLVVEVDGGQHNEERDAERTAMLERAGLRVVRFWNNEVLENLEGVLVRLAEMLEEQRGLPSPSQS